MTISLRPIISIDLSVDIARSPEVVFAAYTDIPSIPQWTRPVKAIRNFSGVPVGVGTTFSQVMNFLAKQFITDVEIIEYSPGKMVKQKVGGVVPGELTATFEAIPNGTRLHIEFNGEATEFFNIATALLKSNMQKQMTTDFKALKQRLEA